MDSNAAIVDFPTARNTHRRRGIPTAKPYLFPLEANTEVSGIGLTQFSTKRDCCADLRTRVRAFYNEQLVNRYRNLRFLLVDAGRRSACLYPVVGFCVTHSVQRIPIKDPTRW